MSKESVSDDGGNSPVDANRKTRRAALGTLVCALAFPTIGSTVSALGDPIFAAIARHRAACEAREATTFAMDDVINTREASQAEWDAYDRAHESEQAAFNDLLANAPKTAAGMRAIIAHVISLDDGRLSQEMRQLLALLERSPVLAS